jgi:TonB family protein
MRLAGSRHAPSRRATLEARAVIAGLLVALGAPGASGAQSVGAVAGVVTDSSGSPLGGVEILMSGGEPRTRSDERGAFLLTGVATGERAVVARRLGFRAESVYVRIGAGDTAVARLRLRGVAPMLSMVVVRARKQRSGRLADYYDRLESGNGGYFITRDRLDFGDPRSLTDVLRRAPGVDVIRGRVRLRGRSCPPLVWLDGSPMPAGEVDINSFPPSSIEGIELYGSATGVPFRYQGSRDSGRCGTILLWSRGPEPVMEYAATAVPGELDRQHGDSTLFVAGEVDLAAHLPEGRSLEAHYPPELASQRLAGVVIAEFVVDSAGAIEPGTLGIVSSPHPTFSRAVRDAIAGASFAPAMRAGRPVRQLVQLRFVFEPR